MKLIPYSKQSISKSDIENVINTLKSDYLTTGPETEKFEKKIANYLGVKYVVAVNSATSALHLSCLALGLEQNDFFWTSNNSFVASANCGVLCGAKPDLVDIDLKDYNLSIDKFTQKIKKTKKSFLPKIVIPVHMAGYPAQLDKLKKLSKIYKFKILEDASHAFGSIYKKEKIGTCKYSDITVFSFHPVKIFTSGEGGIAVTNNKLLFKKLKMLRNHGITKNKNDFKFRKDNPVYYEQQELGLNYRLSDIHASLGISQLNRLNLFYKKRNLLKKTYDEKLKNLPFLFPKYNKKIKFSNHLYIVMLDPKKTKKSRNKLIKYLETKKIITSIHYIPIHKQPFYNKFKFYDKDFKNSIFYYKNAITLPLYPDLTLKEQKYIISAINSFFK